MPCPEQAPCPDAVDGQHSTIVIVLGKLLWRARITDRYLLASFVERGVESEEFDIGMIHFLTNGSLRATLRMGD